MGVKENRDCSWNLNNARKLKKMCTTWNFRGDSQKRKNINEKLQIINLPPRLFKKKMFFVKCWFHHFKIVNLLYIQTQFNIV